MTLPALERQVKEQAEALRDQATAMEHVGPALNAIARQLGQINKKLDKLDKLDSIERVLVEIRDKP